MESLKIVPGKPDADIAAEIKVRMVNAVEPIMAVIDDAKAAGFGVAFSIGEGPLGKSVLQVLKVSKEF